MSKQFEAVVIPKWGIEMTHGKIVEWRFSEGQPMQAGDELVDIETDKIVNSYEARVSGTLARIVVEEDEELPVGALIGVVALGEYETADVDAFIEQYAGQPAAEDEETVAAADTAAVEASAGAAGEIKISPALARKLAKAGIDPASVTGSGPGGRIVKDDVDRALSAAQDGGAEVEAAGDAGGSAGGSTLSSAQSRVATSLMAAQSSVPIYHVQRDVAVGPALASLREKLGGGGGLINTLVMQAVARALVAHPALNRCYDGERISTVDAANVAIAVARDDGAVAAPVVKAVDALAAPKLGSALADLVGRARSGRLVADDMAPAAITVSNLGMYGVSGFTAMVTPPQILVLSLGAVRTVPHWDGGQFVPVEQMSLTLGSDHRLVNGAQAAEFLRTIAESIEA